MIIKSYNKSIEWLNYIIATQLKLNRESCAEDYKQNEYNFVWAVFSLIGTYALSQIPNNKSIFLYLSLPLVFLLIYFLFYKILIIGIWKWLASVNPKIFGYQIAADDNTCREKVFLFNGNLSNQVILSHGFMIKHKENCVEQQYLRDYYLGETLHYLKNPINEIHTIVIDDEIFDKVISVEPQSESEKSIKIYRLLKMLDLINVIIDYIESELANSAITNISLFSEDLKNTRGKYDQIIKKLKQRGF